MGLFAAQYFLENDPALRAKLMQGLQKEIAALERDEARTGQAFGKAMDAARPQNCAPNPLRLNPGN